MILAQIYHNNKKHFLVMKIFFNNYSSKNIIKKINNIFKIMNKI